MRGCDLPAVSRGSTEINKASVFSVLMSTRWLRDHSATASSAGCIFWAASSGVRPRDSRERSSAYCSGLTCGAAVLMAWRSDAVARQYSSGDRGLPCGVPCWNTLNLLRASFHRTAARRSDRKAWIHRRVRFGRPQLARSRSRPPLQTLSKAALKSMATTRDLCLSCRPSNAVCAMFRTPSTEDRPALNPDCSAGMMLLASAQACSLPCTRRSATFETQESRETGL